ncbi:MAG: CoA transferase [Gammaproteobacteria bacterium]|nr:CoA transferase [Gammaproteobacteria bacterium]NIO26656.1 CoA transferase [Gammaproteobacteria bacterium]NIO67209.1 CoA transferase [Gammaproteobacteria bacterium]NIP47260.1 CoA transferase [Gammaproteobacteria bacterium]NIP66363.1 CoA transferase [Gammaproteobacteria bacterium]
MNRAPLNGLLVVSLEQAVAAPFCTSRLADSGARVIKVEREGGDFARSYDSDINGESVYFVWLNRGKESLVLDIKDADDAALLERIVAKADVFVQNLAPGAAARAGFGSAALRERYPRLITCDISGYGDCGDYADMRAYDMLVQAESGLCSITGSPEQPGRIGVSACDIGTGMYACAAILEALYARERSGEGSAIALSMFGAMSDWMAVPLLRYDYAGAKLSRTGLSHPMIQPYGAYTTRNGPPIMIAVQNRREYVRLCNEVLEMPELIEDARFSDNPSRCQNAQALKDIIDAHFQSMDREVLLKRLRASQIAFGEVNDVEGLSGHPALRRVQVDTPNGPVSMVAPPACVAGSEQRLRPVPALGEHSEAIRTEFA